MYGGYCFLNNAAIAAQWFRDHGARRVAVLDIDFHHGNGTQDIFYEHEDVLYLSLYGDPREAFPHFSGYLEETGQGAGEGTTFNRPMLPGTRFEAWCNTLKEALEKLDQFGAETIVVSLGVGTFEQDPISFFKLKSDDFLTIGKLIAERAIAAGVNAVVFDRGAYRYHGRVKALADAAREGGLSF